LKKLIVGLKIFSLSLLLVSCGYKPSSEYTSEILGNKIETNVEIDVKNPIDSIYLKDALNEAVLNVFNARIAKDSYTSKIKLDIVSSKLNIIDYDKDGYPVLYRADVEIKAYVTDVNNTTSVYTGRGSYDFSISSNSVLSDNLQHNAIKEAFLQALQEIEFKIAQKGIDDSRDK